MAITQIKDNELCYTELNNYPNFKIYFYDFKERKEITSISNIDSISNVLKMITKDILIVFGMFKLSLINVNKRILFRIILNTEWAFGFCKLNENMFLTGSGDGIISQWIIEGDNIALIHRKEKAHEKAIFTLIKIGRGIIVSGSADNTIKFW
jgi:WD40 repeat protein